jgi:hypothetical protein
VFLSETITGVSMSTRAHGYAVSLPSLILAAVLLGLTVPGSGMAQVLYGSILGDVKDSSGASVSGAAIAVTNKNT